MVTSPLSFAWLEARIQAIPDGPVGDLATPRSYFVWNAIGTVGIALGLLPFVLIHVVAPQAWMVGMAKGGVWLAVIGYAPGFLRSVVVLLRSFWRWRAQLTDQLDHDLLRFRDLSCEVSQFPRAVIAEHLKFAQTAQARMSAKLAFLFGSLDKLGALPAIVAFGLQLKAYGDLESLQFWQAIVGLFLAIGYFMGLLGSQMRLRLQLYESVLADALQQIDPEMDE